MEFSVESVTINPVGVVGGSESKFPVVGLMDSERSLSFDEPSKALT